jgi:hypothetical protein
MMRLQIAPNLAEITAEIVVLLFSQLSLPEALC